MPKSPVAIWLPEEQASIWLPDYRAEQAPGPGPGPDPEPEPEGKEMAVQLVQLSPAMSIYADQVFADIQGLGPFGSFTGDQLAGGIQWLNQGQGVSNIILYVFTEPGGPTPVLRTIEGFQDMMGMEDYGEYDGYQMFMQMLQGPDVAPQETLVIKA